MRKLNIVVKGRYPVYVGEFADGTALAMSFPTCAKKFARGEIEFANGRALVSQVKNPPFLGNAHIGTKPNPVNVPLVNGYVRLSDTEVVRDPMTEAAKRKAGISSKALKAMICELADALENRINDVDELLARARQITA